MREDFTFRSRALRLAFALLLVLALLALTAPMSGLSAAAPQGGDASKTKAPQAADAEPSVFGETIEVRVVNLEAVVVDRKGQRVTGLKPSDFRLKVDGRVVPIAYFTEVASGRAVAEGVADEGAAGEGAADEGTAGESPAGASGGAQPAVAGIGGVEPGGDVGTNYVVFVDDLFTTFPRDRNLVLKGIAEGLSRLGPQDRMAIVAYGGRTPELISNWSQSPADLREAIDKAVERRSRGLGLAAEVRAHDALGAEGGVESGNPLADIGQDASACMVIGRIESYLQRVVTGVTSTMRSFAGAPGRKVMLLVSGGWPRSAGEYLLGSIGPTAQLPGCRMAGPALYEPINEVANRLGFTLYPILAPDLPSAIDASDRAARDPLAVNSQWRFSQAQETLYHLARQTGGEAYAGGARLAALGSVVDDTRSYYWLGFTPTWKGDDTTHKVRLEVTRPGLQVRTRQGYLDLSRRSEVTYLVESALLFGQAPGTLPLPIQLGPMPAGKGKARVTLKVGIPMQLVTMVPQGKQYVAELELRVALLNDKGDRNDIPVIPVKLGGKEPPKPGQHAVYEVELEVRRERQDVVVALFDPPSGRILESKAVLKP